MADAEQPRHRGAGYESVRVSFVEALEKMSKGRIKIQLHPVGALFPVQEGLEAVNGVVEIAMMTGGYFRQASGPIATIEQVRSARRRAHRNGALRVFLRQRFHRYRA